MSATVADLYEFGLARRDLLRRFAWAVAGLGAIRAKGVVFLPLTLWILGPGEYGRLAVTLAVASMIGSFVLLNIPDGAGRLVVSAPTPEAAMERVACVRRLCAAAAVTLAAVGVCVVAAGGSRVVGWAALVAAAAATLKVGGVHLEYFQQTRRLVRIQIAAEYCAVAIGLALALAFGATGMLAASAVVLSAAGVRAWHTARTVRVGSAAIRAFVSPALRLSLPLLPVSVAQWALYSLDSLLVYHTLGAAQTGAYSAAYSVGSIALLLPYGVNAIWAPTAQRLLARSPDELRRTAVTIGRLLALAGGLVVALAAAASVLGSHLLSSETYRDVPTCLPWIAVGFVALAFAKLFEGILYALRAPALILTAYVVGSAANALLNVVWIPRLGIVGAAYATAAGYGVTAIAVALLACSVFRRRRL